MQMKSDDKLNFCMVFVYNQDCTIEILKKLYHLNAFDH